MFVNCKLCSRLVWPLVIVGAFHGAPAPAQAAPTTCRSGTAAAQGGQSGYENDTKKADEAEQRDREVSDILGRCVGGVTGILTIPTFPSLDEIFKRIKDQVCYIASSRVHEALGSVTGQIDDAIRRVPGRDGSVSVPVPITPPPTSLNTAPASKGPTGLVENLNRIWR